MFYTYNKVSSVPMRHVQEVIPSYKVTTRTVIQWYVNLGTWCKHHSWNYTATLQVQLLLNLYPLQAPCLDIIVGAILGRTIPLGILYLMM